MENNSVVLTSPPKMMVPIIKAVGDFCNLRCRYCFSNAKDQSTFRVMNDELVEKFICQYMELFSGHLLFIWHGGEPLLAGLSFFRKVVDLQRKNIKTGQTIHNAIQTNATLINDDWAEFFKQHDFDVGVSLDGDRKSHDHFRVRPNGRGSFDAVMKGIETLRTRGVEPGIIQTLSGRNMARVKEDFDFFVNILGAKSWAINISKETVMDLDFANYLRNAISLWLECDDPDVRIREIENFTAGVLGKLAFGCEFNGSCGDFFCVEHDGKIYPCDRFCNPEFLLGDLTKESLLEILGGPRRSWFKENVSTIRSECVVCEWQKACHNGCPYYRVSGISGKYNFCSTRKATFSYLQEKVKEYRSLHN